MTALESQTPDAILGSFHNETRDQLTTLNTSISTFRNETRDQLTTLNTSISTLNEAVGSLSDVCQTIIEDVGQIKASVKRSAKSMAGMETSVNEIEGHVDDLTDYASALSGLPREVDGLFYTLKRVDENIAKIRQNPPMSTQTRHQLIPSFMESVLKQGLAVFRKDFLEETATLLTTLLDSHVAQIVTSLNPTIRPSHQQLEPVVETAISKALNGMAGSTDSDTQLDSQTETLHLDRNMLWQDIIASGIPKLLEGIISKHLSSGIITANASSSLPAPNTEENPHVSGEQHTVNISLVDDLLASPPYSGEMQLMRPPSLSAESSIHSYPHLTDPKSEARTAPVPVPRISPAPASEPATSAVPTPDPDNLSVGSPRHEDDTILMPAVQHEAGVNDKSAPLSLDDLINLQPSSDSDGYPVREPDIRSGHELVANLESERPVVGNTATLTLDDLINLPQGLEPQGGPVGNESDAGTHYTLDGSLQIGLDSDSGMGREC